MYSLNHIIIVHMTQQLSCQHVQLWLDLIIGIEIRAVGILQDSNYELETLCEMFFFLWNTTMIAICKNVTMLHAYWPDINLLKSIGRSGLDHETFGLN